MEPAKLASKVVFFTAIFSFLATPSVAVTGNELLEWCSERGDRVEEAFCLGYVVGIRDILPACVPQTVTNGQLTDIVRKYLEENPVNREGPSALLILKAVQNAYHCTNQAWLDFMFGLAKGALSE